MTTVEFTSTVLGDESSVASDVSRTVVWAIAGESIAAGKVVRLKQSETGAVVEIYDYVGTPSESLPPYGIALTAATAGNSIPVVISGMVPNSITGLLTSGSTDPAVVSSAGAPTRLAAYLMTDWVIGVVDEQGRLQLRTPIIGYKFRDGVTVSSATNLRALLGVSGQVVTLERYSASQLTGGGTFVWDTTSVADDGVTRFNSGGLASSSAGWQRIYSGALDVTWGGATGDGSTNDTAAIQRVFNAAATLSSQVFIPDGTYIVNSGLTVASTTASPISVFGTGRLSHIVSTIAGTDTTAIAASGATFSDFTLRDIRLSGTFSRGVSLVAASGGNVRVERCDISGHTAFAGGVTLAGIRIGGIDDVWLVDNVISGGGYANGDGSGQGYDIVKNSGAVQSRIHCIGNKVTGGDTIISVALFDCADSEVRGNYVDQGNTPGTMGPPITMGYGITMYDVVGASTCRRNIVTGNTVVNCAGMGIYLEQQYDSVVGDNICRDTCKQITEPSLPLAAIVANGAACTINDNVVKTTTGSTHGIAFTHPSTVVTGNHLEPNSAGIKVAGDAHRSTIAGNSFISAVHGVLVDGVDPIGLTITGNSFASVSAPLSVQPGATLTGSTFGHNTIDSPQIGVLLSAGVNNTIASNHITGSSSWGIQVLSNLNDVVGNMVTGATADGGILYQGDLGRIVGNTATGNTGTQVSITGANCYVENNRTSAAGALGAADEVLQFNSAGTATEWGKIADANIATNAAINITKLAGGTKHREMLAWNENGDIWTIDPGQLRTIYEWRPSVGAAFGVFSGWDQVTTNGTPSHPGMGTGSFLAQSRRTQMETGVGANDVAGFESVPVAWRGTGGLGGFFFWARFAMSTSTAGTRCFIGLAESGGNANCAADPGDASSSNCIGVGYDAADTNWQVIRADGVPNVTKVNTGLAKDGTTVLELRMFCDPADSKIFVQLYDFNLGVFHINTSYNTTLPTDSITLSAFAYCGTAASAVAQDLQLYGLRVESHY